MAFAVCLQVPIEVTLPDPVMHVVAGEHHTLCLTKADEASVLYGFFGVFP
jgi:hypothetical protein